MVRSRSPCPTLFTQATPERGAFFALAVYKRVKLLTVVQCLFHGLIVQYLFHGSSKITLRCRLHERGCPLGSRVTLGSRVSLLLCLTQFVLHVREGAPMGRVSLP